MRYFCGVKLKGKIERNLKFYYRKSEPSYKREKGFTLTSKCLPIQRNDTKETKAKTEECVQRTY